jgi:hypothetical protein
VILSFITKTECVFRIIRTAVPETSGH